MAYGISFFSLTKVKLSVFAVLATGHLAFIIYKVNSNETVYWASPEQFIPSTIFLLAGFYVVAAVIELIYFKVR